MKWLDPLAFLIGLALVTGGVASVSSWGWSMVVGGAIVIGVVVLVRFATNGRKAE